MSNVGDTTPPRLKLPSWNNLSLPIIDIRLPGLSWAQSDQTTPVSLDSPSTAKPSNPIVPASLSVALAGMRTAIPSDPSPARVRPTVAFPSRKDPKRRENDQTNVAKNPFLRILQSHHLDLVALLLSNNLILCLPPPALASRMLWAMGKHWPIERRAELSESALNTLEKDALASLDSRLPIEFWILGRISYLCVTLESETLELLFSAFPRQVVTGRGFSRPGKRLAIVADELFTDDYGRSFSVYVLAGPLRVPITNESNKDDNSHEGDRESLPLISENLESDQYAGPQGLARVFALYPTKSSARATLQKLSSHLQSFTDRIMPLSTLKELRELSHKVQEECMDMVLNLDREGLQRMLELCELEEAQFWAVLESFVAEQTYDILFFKISGIFRREDQSLQSEAEKLRYLDVRNLDLDEALGAVLYRAVRIFPAVTFLRTPGEKLHALAATMRALVDSSAAYRWWRRMNWSQADVSSIQLDRDLFDLPSSETFTSPLPQDSPKATKLSSDDLVPLLILAVVRITESTAAQLIATFRYMADFATWNDIEQGEWAFVLATMESALTWLVSGRTTQDIDSQGEPDHVTPRTDSQERPHQTVSGSTSLISESPSNRLQSSRMDIEEVSLWNGRWWDAVKMGDLHKCQEIVSGYAAAHADRFPSFTAARDDQGDDAVIIATRHSRSRLVEFLVSPSTTEAGLPLPIHSVNFAYETPIHLAVSNADIETLNVLLAYLPPCHDKYHPYVNVPNAAGLSPLLIAATLEETSSLKIVKVLLRSGANPNCVNLDGRTAFHLGHASLMPLLYEYGGRWDLKALDNLPPLLYRCIEKDVAGMIGLLDVERRARIDGNSEFCSIDWNAADLGGRSVLHYISLRG
ncbi:hypothetical protein HDU93_006809, partial [Gonapodya sp. JEL0774]